MHTGTELVVSRIWIEIIESIRNFFWAVYLKYILWALIINLFLSQQKEYVTFPGQFTRFIASKISMRLVEVSFDTGIHNSQAPFKTRQLQRLI
jgi:hypothetical protein